MHWWMDQQHAFIDWKQGVDIGIQAFTSKSRVVTLGLIALSKLLSTSHGSLPYSLTYKLGGSKEGLDTSKFKGYSENQFGMKSYLAKLFLHQKEDLLKFFEQVIDENSNKLVLAVSTFINSEWLVICCQVYTKYRFYHGWENITSVQVGKDIIRM